MSHASRTISQMITEKLNDMRKEEERKLPAGKFVGYASKGYKYTMLFIAILGTVSGCLISIPGKNPDAGAAIGAIGLLTLLTLPTYFSYRCYVDMHMLKKEYYILCFKIKKKVLWKDVKYKKIKRDSAKEPFSIRLYDASKKKLISFDNGLVGFGKIVQMASGIISFKK